jgi:hypothetical protein
VGRMWRRRNSIGSIHAFGVRVSGPGCRLLCFSAERPLLEEKVNCKLAPTCTADSGDERLPDQSDLASKTVSETFPLDSPSLRSRLAPSSASALAIFASDRSWASVRSNSIKAFLRSTRTCTGVDGDIKRLLRLWCQPDQREHYLWVPRTCNKNTRAHKGAGMRCARPGRENARRFRKH